MALRPLVERVLRRARVPERDVPDVFQNVLLAVWPWWAERSAAPSSPAHDTRPAYVVVVARRMAMQHHRRWCHRGEVLEWDDRDDRHAPTPTHAPSPPSPEDSLIEAEAEAERATEAELEALSEATPPARWRAFYAYAVEELPVARIAASEHAPRATIYTRIRLAREDLRAALVRLRAARRRR